MNSKIAGLIEYGNSTVEEKEEDSRLLALNQIKMYEQDLLNQGIEFCNTYYIFKKNDEENPISELKLLLKESIEEITEIYNELKEVTSFLKLIQ